MSKKGTVTFTIVIMLTVFVLLAAAAIFFSLIKEKRVLLNNFFIKDSDVVGVDISSYQGEVDMDALASQGIKFAYLKATEGSSHEDPNFQENWEKARKSPLKAGAYHFFSFDSSGDTQAQNYIRAVGSLDEMLIPAVNVEYYDDKNENPPSVDAVVSELQEFLDILMDEYGVYPLIYADNFFYETYLRGHFDQYPKWMRSVYYPLELGYRGSWVIWQYLDRGELEGYDSSDQQYIDLNVLNRNSTLDDITVPLLHLY